MPGYDMMFRKSRGSLSWNWASERLSESRNYFLVTSRLDGRPHAIPVWGLWLDDAFYFSTGRKSRKARHLAARPDCIVCPDDASEAVVLEGTAQEVAASSLPVGSTLLTRRSTTGKLKEKGLFYKVRPHVVFGLVENGRANPTRWLFSGSG